MASRVVIVAGSAFSEFRATSGGLVGAEHLLHLHDVLGVHHRAEHSVRDHEQVRPQLLVRAPCPVEQMVRSPRV